MTSISSRRCFHELNEAVPLNAAEKRNAFGGPLPKIVRRIAATPFFRKKLKLSNKRYQHRDLAAKMVYLAHHRKIVDTKKVYLDNFFIENKAEDESAFHKTTNTVRDVLTTMNSAFTAGDKLLRSSGMVILYYLLFEKAHKENWIKGLTRSLLTAFEDAREKNRRSAGKT